MGLHSMACEMLPKVRLNLFPLTCKLLHGNKITSDHQNNIVVESSEGDIVLDCHIKTCNGWVTGVEFLHETSQEGAYPLPLMRRKMLMTYMLN